MKFNKIFFGALAALAALVTPACQSEGIGEPVISTDVAQVEVAMDGGSTIIYVTSTRDWTATVAPATSQDDVTGISVTPESGDFSRCGAAVRIVAEKNEGYPRAALISFIAGNVSTAITVNQDGPKERPAQKLTVAEFLAKPQDASVWYELTGKIENLANTTYGNFDLVDETGKIYVYGLTATKVDSNDKSFSSLGLKEGDIVTLKGTRSSYGGTAQVGGPAYYISHTAGEAPKPGELQKVSVLDFLSAEVSTTQPYQLTGRVANIQMDKNDPTLQNKYGNFDLVDATGSVYVYGLTTAKVAKNDKSFANTGVKEGDIVTLVGTRAAYNGQDQVGGPAYYIFHEEGATIDWSAEGIATAVNGEEAADDALLKELKVIVDDANLYVRATATAALDGANYFDVSFCDGNGENAVWWGWTTTGANTYWKEHKGTVDAEGNLTAMQFSFNGEYKDIAVSSEKVGDDVVWTLTYPREYVAAYEANGKIFVSAFLWKDWGGYWAIPARGGEMLEVTLP